MHDPAQSLFGVIAVLAIVLLIFLAIRALMLWYWKINIMVNHLSDILAELKKMNGSKIGEKP